MNDLRCYLVGGAVRDALLGLPVKDRDWVVVGATVDAMLARGFTQVGRDFPVFIHPSSGEEYALARTERKQGAGHTGFAVFAEPSVTLEEDLARRDLTINAIAQDDTGALIDPYGGVGDIEQKCLRHVSPAFAEDPLRVLRVARFAAQLPDFVVHSTTLAFMRAMTAADALAELSAERVWQEVSKALGAQRPERFFGVLAACGGLVPWFAELADVLEFPGHTALGRYARFPITEEAHCQLHDRLKVPNEYRQAADDWHRYGSLVQDWQGLPVDVLANMFHRLHVAHRLDRLHVLLAVGALKAPGLLNAAEHYAAVRLSAKEREGLSGPEVGRALAHKRMDALQRALSDAD